MLLLSLHIVTFALVREVPKDNRWEQITDLGQRLVAVDSLSKYELMAVLERFEHHVATSGWKRDSTLVSLEKRLDAVDSILKRRNTAPLSRQR